MSNDNSSPRHPIRVVAHRTGLTPATIRAWERRYDAVEPARSEGGQRLYSDDDISRLNTLRALTDMGRSIGRVAALPAPAAEALLSEDLEAAPVDAGSLPAEEQEPWVDDAYGHLTNFDSRSLEQVLWRALRSLGARHFLGGVVAPLLARVGTGWAAGRVTPGQEHLGTGALERVLAWMNDPAMSSADGPRVVVTTLPGDRHALGARLAAAAAAVEGWHVTYLGADLPLEDIAAAASKTGAQAVAISVVRTDSTSETANALADLRDLLGPDVTVMVGGSGARLLKPGQLPTGVEIVEDLDGFALPHGNGRRT